MPLQGSVKNVNVIVRYWDAKLKKHCHLKSFTVVAENPRDVVKKVRDVRPESWTELTP